MNSFIDYTNRPGIRSSYLLIAFLFFGFGCLLNSVAYQSIAPIIACLIFYFFGSVLLRFPLVGGNFERKGYRTVFSVCWFMAGIAAIYANLLNDVGENTLDSGWFFRLASEGTAGSTLANIRLKSEGAGAVIIWRTVYDIFAELGFEKRRYIGILVNVISVAFSCVIAVKTARIIHGYDKLRLDRLILLFALCGIFWLSAAIHLRDGLILLVVVFLIYSWIRYLVDPGLRDLIIVSIVSVLSLMLLAILRVEFRFVPVSMFTAAFASTAIFGKLEGFQRQAIYMLACLGATVVVTFNLGYLVDVVDTVSAGHRAYLEFSSQTSSRDSLGMFLIVNQAVPLRLLLGSIYLYVFPIPFWSGFQLDSAYHLFKTFNVLYFYFVIPLMILSTLQILRFRSLRSPATMFLVFLILGFTLAVAGTSLEGRHLGAFLVPVILVSLIPDLSSNTIRKQYFRLLGAFLPLMAFVHIAWLIVKL